MKEISNFLNLIPIIKLYPLWAQISILICVVIILSILFFAPRETLLIAENEKKKNNVNIEKIDHAGDIVAGDKIIIQGDATTKENNKEDVESKIKIAKVKINRELEDFEHIVAETYEFFRKEAEALAGQFNTRGMLTSGVFIKAQMELSQKTKEKIDRLWLKMDRNIEDTLINSFNITSFTPMINEFLKEHNKRSDLFNAKKEIYHYLESSPKSWEIKIFNEEKITKNFKLQ
ncbi:MAG: hypothetical protein ABII88_02660 [Candidatus Omnitrophota bacterium]